MLKQKLTRLNFRTPPRPLLSLRLSSLLLLTFRPAGPNEPTNTRPGRKAQKSTHSHQRQTLFLFCFHLLYFIRGLIISIKKIEKLSHQTFARSSSLFMHTALIRKPKHSGKRFSYKKNARANCLGKTHTFYAFSFPNVFHYRGRWVFLGDFFLFYFSRLPSFFCQA